MIERKDRKVLELETQATELKHIKLRLEQRLAESSELIARLREKLRHRPVQEKVGEEADRLKQLRAQLAGKEKKISGLRKAVIALKDEFVRAEEEHEADLIARDRVANRENQEPGSPAEDPSVQKQVDALRKRVEAANTAMRKSKKAAASLKAENRKLHDQLQEALAEAEETTGEDNRRELEQSLAKLQNQNSRLKQRLRDFKEGNSPREESTKLQHEIQALKKKVKLLEAQNNVLRSESAEAGTSNTGKAQNLKRWEAEKRMEKRLQSLRAKLEEKERELVAAR